MSLQIVVDRKEDRVCPLHYDLPIRKDKQSYIGGYKDRNVRIWEWRVGHAQDIVRVMLYYRLRILK